MNSFSKRRNAAGALAITIAALLTACGGGSDSSSDTTVTNQNPVADAGTDLLADANTLVQLDGSGNDSDGTIASFKWTQTAGTSVTMVGDDGETPSFTAPDVTESEVLTFELSVTDNAGGTGTDTVGVTVAPVVALSGRVYDGPIANAGLTITVGDRSYTATADADGNYMVNIGAVDPDAFVTISAVGAEAQENAELLSIAGSFGALRAAAGDDGVLEDGESGSVNVTNLSTAKAVLMIKANGGNDIADAETLANSETLVNGDDLLYLATVIKLVIDGGYALPEGVSSTLDLVRDSEKTETFVSAVEAADATAFETTFESIITDSTLVAGYSSTNMPTELFSVYIGGMEDRSATYRRKNRGNAWTFQSNGSGTYSNAEHASTPFSWTLNEGKIASTFDTPLFSQGYCTHPDITDGSIFPCESTTTVKTISLVVDGDRADSLLIASTGETTYPNNGELRQPIAFSGNGSSFIGLQKSSAVPFVEADVPGRWMTAVTGRTPATVADVMHTNLDTGFLEFQADGNGIRTATDYAPEESFTWSIVDGALRIEYVNGDIVHFYQMRHDGDVYDTLALLSLQEGGSWSDAGLMLEVDVNRLPMLETADVPGRYMLFETENSFNIRIDTNGTGANENFDGTQFVDGFPFSWTLRDDHVVSMKYNWNPSTGNSATCIEVNDCHNWMDRLWYPAAYNDATGRVYLLEIQQYYDWNDNAVESKGPMNYYQPSIRYWRRTELDTTTANAKTSRPDSKANNKMSEILDAPMLNSR